MRGLMMNFSELPEMVIVETRFITQKAAQKAHIDAVATLTDAEVKQELEEQSRLQPPPLVACGFEPHLSPPQKPQMVDAHTGTDSPQPMRERAMQTENPEPTTATVATQCNLEAELDDAFGTETDEPEATAAAAQAAAEENARFLEFANAKSYVYGNGKRECLICGEIGKNARTMRAHLALHWGPAVLCFQCGIQFEHTALLRAHDCCRRKTKQTKKAARHKCPHYRCSVVAISLLELYDHINEHAAEYSYRCSGCQRAFRTAGELRRHLPLRLQCLEEKHQKHQSLPYPRFNAKADAAYRVRTFALHTLRRKRVLVKSFLSQRMLTRSWNSQRRCQICLQRCSNAFKFANHTRRCLKGLRLRLERKRNGGSEQPHRKPLLNGCGI